MFFSKKFTLVAVAVLAGVIGVHAETHTVHFDNHCGYGTPTLVSNNGAILSTGGDYTSSGELLGFIAYLQTGACGLNGENCIIIEGSLKNGCAGCSSVDLSLIPPHAFSETAGFGFYNGCDGAGADCTSASCTTAYHSSGDNQVIVGCSSDNVDLAITFCD